MSNKNNKEAMNILKNTSVTDNFVTEADKMFQKLGFIVKYESDEFLCFINEHDEVIQFVKNRNYGVSAFRVEDDDTINHALGFDIPELKAIYKILEERGALCD